MGNGPAVAPLGGMFRVLWMRQLQVRTPAVWWCLRHCLQRAWVVSGSFAWRKIGWDDVARTSQRQLEKAEDCAAQGSELRGRLTIEGLEIVEARRGGHCSC